jgi:glucose-1-phosphate thymidylyltransferase
MLELILENLADAGFVDLCLVIGPEHDTIRKFCSVNDLQVSFAVQQEPLGTSDAVLAAESFIGPDDLFLVVNSDNLYPVEGLRRLRNEACPALIGFERSSLIAKSNISEDRIAKFAAVEIDDERNLIRIVEKPKDIAASSYVSMNAWLFSPKIFDACKAIGPSERGEYEITAAVQYSIDVLGERFAVVTSNEGVLDLSSRADIESVSRFVNSL